MNSQPRWEEIPRENLETIYNPRAAGPNVEAGLARRVAESNAAHDQLHGNCRAEIDLRYGPGEKQTLDLYRPQNSPPTPAPMAIFIHGGYWRAGDKQEATLVVPPLLNAGAVVANVNYDLCPDITLDTMVQQIVSAVRYCHQHATEWNADPNRLTLIGHSAGAHLAARVMNAAADDHGLPANLIQNVIAISGIYEPEVITQITVNEVAQIDTATARRNDCLVNPPSGNAKYLVIAGGDEPAGWIEQSRLYADVVRKAGYECEYFVLNGTDHFTVGCEMFAPGSENFDRIGEYVSMS
jgi:arylformamidase